MVTTARCVTLILMIVFQVHVQTTQRARMTVLKSVHSTAVVCQDTLGRYVKLTLMTVLALLVM
jgi:hypothetical protein